MFDSAVQRAGAILAGAFVLMLSGCFGSQGTPAVPARGSTADPFAGGLSPAKLLQLQVQGRLQGPVPRNALRQQLSQTGLSRPHFTLHPDAAVGLWTSNTNFNYVLGQNAAGTQTEKAIDVSQNGCYSPVALKVDAARNLWVACELTSPSTVTGVLQEYSSSGSLENRFAPQCPKNVAKCTSFSGYGYDSGLDAQHDVFASLNLYSMEVCNPTCNSTLGAGFEWWPKGAAPSAKPKLISVGTSCAPICGVGYMDVDGNGNLWFTFAGYDGSGNYGFGLGEVKSPTTNPALKIVEPIGSYQFFGGVYVSAQGTVLNVIDQDARTVSQYRLPLAKNGKPFATLGPTVTTVFGVGDPVSGGYNKTESNMAIGDSGAWIDVGTVASNAWTAKANLNFYSGIDGAAYTPSDK